MDITILFAVSLIATLILALASFFIVIMVEHEKWYHIIVPFLCVIMIVLTGFIYDVDLDIVKEDTIVEYQLVQFNNGLYVKKMTSETGEGNFIRISEEEIKEISYYTTEYVNSNQAVYKEIEIKKEWKGGILTDEYIQRVLILPADTAEYTIVS